MAIANAIHKLSDFVNKICCVLCVIILVSMVVVTGMQIVCRLLFTALTWSEEVTRYLLVWSTFIGAGIVYKASGHISVTLVQDCCPAMVQKLLKLVVHIICFAFCAATVYFGFKYMNMQGKQLSAALRIPMKYMYMAIPICGIIIDIHALDAIVSMFTKKEGEAA